MLLRILATLMTLLVIGCSSAFAVESARGVTASTVINASKDQVWNVISATGHFDDKLQSVEGNEAIVEQKFKTLPLLSAIVIIVKAKVTPKERIDFEMLKCDRLKAFAGSWVVVPISDEKTRLILNMYVDPGLPVPRFLVNQFIGGKVKTRLKKVKLLVERAQAKQS